MHVDVVRSTKYLVDFHNIVRWFDNDVMVLKIARTYHRLLGTLSVIVVIIIRPKTALFLEKACDVATAEEMRRAIATILKKWRFKIVILKST